MLSQARPKDIELFVALAKLGPTSPGELPLKVVIPGFIISEFDDAQPIHSHAHAVARSANPLNNLGVFFCNVLSFIEFYEILA